MNLNFVHYIFIMLKALIIIEARNVKVKVNNSAKKIKLERMA